MDESRWHITYQPVKTNHLLHLLVTMFTCGLWFPVWMIVWFVNAGKTEPVWTRNV